MKYFLTICFLFVVGAMSGYVLELFYRRFAHKKWINPGFLVGPYLPLYGFGVVVLYACTRIFECIPIGNQIVKYIVILITMTIMMTVVEYIAGYIFIVRMHIKLWDYSSRPGNIQGIICPLFTLFWGLISALYLFVIDPFLVERVYWLMSHLEWSFVVGIVIGVMLVDLVYSFKLSLKIKEFAAKNNIVVNYENFKKHIREKQDEFKQKHSFLLPFKESNQTIKEYFASYIEQMKNKKNKE